MCFCYLINITTNIILFINIPNIYCNLGIDSTKTERYEAKKLSRQIYRAIKTLDPEQGHKYLYHMDK